MNIFLEFNQKGLDFLNSFLAYPILYTIAPIFSDLPIFFLPIFLSITWIIYWLKKDRTKQESLLYIFYSCILWLSITLLIQQFFYFDRPSEHVQNVANLILKKIPEASFPSDHASVSMAFMTSLFLWNYKRTFWYTIFFIVTMNVCRIIVWVHWPLDIIVGSLVWISAWCITIKYVTKIKFVKKLNSFIIQISNLIGL